MASPTENQTTASADRSFALFERPVLGVRDEPTFSAVKQAIEGCFAAGTVAAFMKSLERSGLRIRDFEAVLTAGKLGPETAARYAKLDAGDQGQIRELYLAKLEQVDGALRDKYFKLYAYY